MDSHTRRRPIYLGTILCLSGAILLVCLPHLARCGAAHPVITSPKSSNQQANTLTQQQQQQQNQPSNSNQMHLLGRSHQQTYSSSAPMASSNSHRPSQPNLPALSTQNSYAFEDQLASAQQQQSILTRSSQRLQPSILPYNRATGATSTIPVGHSNLVMTNQQQFNNMLANPYTNATHMLLLDLRQQLITRAIKFDEHFRNLLSQSKVGLHNMFVDTYGLIYERNTEIFTNMYEDLTQYYATGQIKLTESMNNFFISLYQKIFQVYNSNKAFSYSYLECATQQLVVLKPFKDAPEKLIDDIRHVFVAARTMNQALNAGIDLIKSIISLGSPPQCTSMTSDKLLRQVEGGKPPCLNFCSEVISRCIGRNNLDSLSNSWKSYVSSLSELAKMLSGRYNIANIITPIDVQISEAIMNFQENAANISQSVFEACSKEPKVGSSNPLMQLHNRISRRAAPVGSLMANSARRNVNQQPASVNEHQFEMATSLDRRYDGSSSQAMPVSSRAQANMKSPDVGSSLLGGISDRPLAIVDEIRTYMPSTKAFWSSLPSAVCTSNQTLSSPAVASNPTNFASRKNQPANCFSEPLAIWDMNSDLRYTLEINQIIERFRNMDSKIRDALAGREIDWSPTQNQRPSSSAAASSSINNSTTRPPIVTYPTSTTISTTPDEDMEDAEEGPLEEGSGSSEDTEEPEMPETAEDETEQEDPTVSGEQAGPPEFALDPAKDDNRIDSKPTLDYPSDKPGFITVDPSPRKSGAVSSLVISEHLLASLFSLAALSVVNILRTNTHHSSFAGRTSP